MPATPELASFNQRQLLILDPHEKLPDVKQQLAPFDWFVLTALDAQSALKIMDNYQIDVAIATVDAKPLHLKELTENLSKIKVFHPKLRWTAITEGQLNRDCKHILAEHFNDYFHQPLDWLRLNDSLGHAYGMAKLNGKTLASSLYPQTLPPILGKHPSLQKLRKDLDKLGQSDQTVLISGETGTGKGLCAKWLHHLSARHEGPFIALNCGALPPTLIQSTLFGFEKGAFTGAEKRYLGYLEQAQGGTLFLDEIADLPLELQVNLLQFLDEKHIYRIGSTQAQAVDCRLLFASHQDLETAVEEGRFREDLFHRINVLRLHVPSLREYMSDIMVIAELFLAQEHPSYPLLSFSDEAKHAIKHYAWPGNVRELQNRIRRGAVMAEPPSISPRDLGLEELITSRRQNPSENSLLNAENLLKAIIDNKHNISAAARQLNVSRSTFYRLIKKCQIKL
ncbi:sigma-54-dependent transcriptional regulator [Shewanella acanthi]|uniref:sigma-54-dependent transcriptional regulator n=1 Tax=Shewanella acanthi TaxID=2864212 RepID=UPI0021ABF027|nr:sigma-54 dependent transcriptional regulator [Shewanella acanthi]